MLAIRCMSCGFAKQRPGYWQSGAFYAQSRIEVNESRTLFYCTSCLAHAEIVLTELIGKDEAHDSLQEKMPFLMRFTTANQSHDDQWFWNYTAHHMWSGER